MDARENLKDWLRDAHAMERATIDNIERLVERLEGHPELSNRYRQHLDESRQQLQRLEQCLGRLGTDASVVKDTATRMLGIFQVYATGATPDEPVKHCLAGYAYENFEIASYTSLIGAAEVCG
jgi:ferritin-like metal-binding protein YciE